MRVVTTVPCHGGQFQSVFPLNKHRLHFRADSELVWASLYPQGLAFPPGCEDNPAGRCGNGERGCSKREHFLERQNCGAGQPGGSQLSLPPCGVSLPHFPAASHPTVLGDRLTLLANSRRDPCDAFTI